MKITRTSPITGITRTKELDVTPERLEIWQAGALIQNVFPNLSADDREFLMTGITADERDELFNDAPDEDGDYEDPAF